MSQSAKCNTGRHLMSLKLYVSKLALFKLYFFKSKSYFKEMEIYFCELKMSFFELKICFLELKMYFCEFKLYLSKCVQICLLCYIDRKLWMYEEKKWIDFKVQEFGEIWWTFFLLFLYFKGLQQKICLRFLLKKENWYRERKTDMTVPFLKM